MAVSYQDPVSANGRIIRFDIKIEDQKDKVKNGSWESVLVNRSEDDSSSSQRKITSLKQADLADKESVKVSVIAVNSLGESPAASLIIPQKGHGRWSWLWAAHHTPKGTPAMYNLNCCTYYFQCRLTQQRGGHVSYLALKPVIADSARYCKDVM